MLFAQIMYEMLQPYAFESFRVHALDTLARLDEASLSLGDVSAQRLPYASLEPILEELIWSLQRDPIAEKIEGGVITELLDRFKPSVKTSIRELSAGVRFLRKRLTPTYCQSLEDLIISLYNTKHKSEFRLAVSCYCSYLINRGYSKHYLLSTIETMFFGDDVRRTGATSLRRLFRKLNGDDKKLRVYAPLDDDFGKYVSRLDGNEVVSLMDLPMPVAVLLNSSTSFSAYDFFLIRTVSAKDPHSALKMVNNYLGSLRAITFLARRGIRFEWSKRMLIQVTRTDPGTIYFESGLNFQREVIPTGRTIRSLRSQSKQILELFDAASTERLLSSINTSALARSSSNLENRLISLWSAVEVLLSDPPSNTARIVHYTDLLVPCICAKYVRRYIIAVYDDLTLSYRSRLKRIIDRIPKEIGTDSYTRFTHLMFDESHNVHRAALFSVLSENPLAMHRLWKLHKDFSSPVSLLKSFDAHQNRVRWQIHRIYRARNHLVHSGQVPTYLESIVLNAFEYYRSAIGSILGQAEKEEGKSNIDQIVSEVSIEYNVYKNFIIQLKKDGFDPSVFARIFK